MDDDLFRSAYHLDYAKNNGHVSNNSTHAPQHESQNSNRQLNYFFRQSIDYTASPIASPGPSTADTTPRRHTPQDEIFLNRRPNQDPSSPRPGTNSIDATTADQINPDASIDEEPLYVNAKQYTRILKRRIARARLEEVHRLSRQRKVNYRVCVPIAGMAQCVNSRIFTNLDTSTPCAAPEVREGDF
jgi:hypothetical protein